MNNIKAEELLNKYANGECTEEELAILHAWYLQQMPNMPVISADEVELAKQEVWDKLPVHGYNAPKTIKLFPSKFVRRTIAAAIALVTLSVGYYFIKKDQIDLTNPLAKQEQIIPGTNKATLTLADGTNIDLNKLTNGVLREDQGARIVKTKDGQLHYVDNDSDEHTKALTWNTLSIPAGGYYNLTLSDGTVVWLNSKSSLKYPTEFVGKERTVELTGEGYFEVAHNSKQPFKVVTDGQTVEVLGTRFNVNAYPDEKSITTTLLKGSVRVNAGKGAQVLSPNQQAKLTNGNIIVKPINAENAIDWVNNDFVFENENLGSIMRKIARWYNVETTYPAHLGNMEFSGSISRKKNITQVLKIMELTGMVNFKIEGRRITVVQ